MTREELFLVAYRLCEARLRKSGPVFSKEEIMEDYPIEHEPEAYVYEVTHKLPDDFYHVMRLG